MAWGGGDGGRLCMVLQRPLPPDHGQENDYKKLLPVKQRGWWCELLQRRLGQPMQPPRWFNDPACKAVDPTTGTQRALECGLFAVNHCLARARLPIINLDEFTQNARDETYEEGDFDDGALRLNLQVRGCSFDRLEGSDHQDAVREINERGLLAIFNGDVAMGCILHQSDPRHWVALVAPVRQESTHVAAILCDSMETCVYGLSTGEMQDLFGMMRFRHMSAAESQAPPLQREQEAADWSAYRVSR